MKEITKTKTITYKWWRTDEENIVLEHIPALEETAGERIGEMMAEGCTSGELFDHIHMISTDPPDGVAYRGWWEVNRRRF